MSFLKNRFKAKLGRRFSRTSGSAEESADVPPTAITPHVTTITEPWPATLTSTISIPERLWNRAYEQAKEFDTGTVDAYEKILSVRLNEGGADISDTTSPPAYLELQQNEIATDPEKRRLQMRQLVEYGLRRTEGNAETKRGMEESIQSVMAVKDCVDKAVHASPEAAIPWVGVCIALEVSVIIIIKSMRY